MVLAQGLPVAGIPEQIHVASVWNDVIDHGCRCMAHGAVRMCCEKRLPDLFPLAGIAALPGAGAGRIVALISGAFA
ncbi:MAG: hypothetical protein KDK26_15175 [Roseivivax sp.]|nr:hypothetical protein [Roseivivax sp.]